MISAARLMSHNLRVAKTRQINEYGNYDEARTTSHLRKRNELITIIFLLKTTRFLILSFTIINQHVVRRISFFQHSNELM